MANVVIEVHKDASLRRDCDATYSSKSSDCERWAASYNVAPGLAADLLRCADVVCSKLKKGVTDEATLIAACDPQPQSPEEQKPVEKKPAPWWCCFADDAEAPASLLGYDAEARLLLKVLRVRFAEKLESHRMGLTVRSFDFGEFRLSSAGRGSGSRSPHGSPRSTAAGGSPSSGPLKAELEFRNPPSLILLRLGGKWTSGASIPLFTRSYVQYLVNTRVEYYEAGGWAERQAQRMAYEGRGPSLPHVESAIPMATVRARLLMEGGDSPGSTAHTPAPSSTGGRNSSQFAFWPPSPLFLPPGLPGETRPAIPNDISDIAGHDGAPVVHRRRSSSGEGRLEDGGSTEAGLAPGGGGTLQRRGGDGDSSVATRDLMRENSTDTEDSPGLAPASSHAWAGIKREGGPGTEEGQQPGHATQRVALGMPGAALQGQAEDAISKGRAGPSSGAGGLTLRSVPATKSSVGRSLRHPSSPLARLVSSPSTGPTSGKVSSLLNPLRTGMMGAAVAAAQAEQGAGAGAGAELASLSSASSTSVSTGSLSELGQTSTTPPQEDGKTSKEQALPPSLPAETGSPPLLALS